MLIYKFGGIIIKKNDEVQEKLNSARCIASTVEDAKNSSIFESGMSRIITNLKTPFILMTAFRTTNDLKRNIKVNGQLMTDFRDYKLGGSHLKGIFIETVETDKKDADDITEKVPTIEESFFIKYTKRSEIAFEYFIF